MASRMTRTPLSCAGWLRWSRWVLKWTKGFPVLRSVKRPQVQMRVQAVFQEREPGTSGVSESQKVRVAWSLRRSLR